MSFVGRIPTFAIAPSGKLAIPAGFPQGGWHSRRNGDCNFVGAHTFNAQESTDIMEIRFISSLTAEDENVFAPALLKAIGALLDQFPIAYTLRIETTGSQVFQHSPAPTRAADPPASVAARGNGTNGTVVHALSARFSDGN